MCRRIKAFCKRPNETGHNFDRRRGLRDRRGTSGRPISIGFAAFRFFLSTSLYTFRDLRLPATVFDAPSSETEHREEYASTENSDQDWSTEKRIARRRA